MTFKPTGIEKFVCSEWSGWDILDEGVWIFFEPKIKGEIMALLNDDREVDHIVFNTQECKVDFCFTDVEFKTLDFKVTF